MTHNSDPQLFERAINVLVVGLAQRKGELWTIARPSGSKCTFPFSS